MRLIYCLALMLVLVVGSIAQQPVMLAPSPTKVDIAPPPSERFPAEWYPPENNHTSMEAPTVGAPFTGKQVMTTKISGQPPWEIHDAIMRDGAGRTRSEESFPQSGLGQNGIREIEVNDRVRHCSFRWTEPARNDSMRQARVICLSPRLMWSEDSMGAKIMQQTPQVSNTFPGEREQSEPLGEKTILGLRALGIRQTRTTTKPDGTTSSYVTEIWWSPQLKELLVMQPVGDVPGMPSIEFRDIKTGEPEGALFYPPAGWKIVPQLPELR